MLEHLTVGTEGVYKVRFLHATCRALQKRCIFLVRQNLPSSIIEFRNTARVVRVDNSLALDAAPAVPLNKVLQRVDG